MFWRFSPSDAQSDRMKVKICGLNSDAAVDAAVEAGADFAGFIFYPRSPRNISFRQAASFAERLPPNVASVAVMVNYRDDTLEKLLENFQPHLLQLHGSESPERVAEIKAKSNLPVIKALPISTAEDVQAARAYLTVADMLLFDAKPPTGMEGMLPGGNGIQFDWTLLAGMQWPVPWMLSGGLTPANVAEAIGITGATMVDASSSLESSPGVKDSAKIHDFIRNVKVL